MLKPSGDRAALFVFCGFELNETLMSLQDVQRERGKLLALEGPIAVHATRFGREEVRGAQTIENQCSRCAMCKDTLLAYALGQLPLYELQ